MPDIFIYALSDFVTPIPDEQGARAAGTPPFVITTGPSLTRIKVAVNDNDGNFDEIDAGQVLAEDLTLDGETFQAGDRIFANYILTDANGFELYSITIGVNNSGRNITTAVATLEPLPPNTTFTFTSETNYNGNAQSFDSFVCFTDGALIETAGGLLPVEQLEVGDWVVTRDSEIQQVRWIGRRRLPKAALAAKARLRPVIIKKGAFGGGKPSRDLMLSPQHRVLIGGRAGALFGADEALTPAKGLVGDLARRAKPMDVTYHHFAFDRHELVRSDGLWTESLLPGDQALSVMSPAQRAEILELFPELAETGGPPVKPARPLVSVTEGRVWARSFQRRRRAALGRRRAAA